MPSPFKDRKFAREAARKGAIAMHAKRKAKLGTPEPFAGTILDMMDAAGFTGPSWDAWRSFWKAVYGLPMDPADVERFTRHTGRTAVPESQVREAWMIVGRRGGKSRMAVLAALHLGIRTDYTKRLAPGERAGIPIISASQLQARRTFGYLKGLVQMPAFAPYVDAKRVLRDAVELRTGSEISVGTASFRTMRGATFAGVVLDEVAFWFSDEQGANPDHEIVGALRPGMATVPGALLLGLSSPYAAKGELYKAHTRYIGMDDPRGLAWNADTLSMNPEFDAALIADAFADDAVFAASEYGQGGSVAFRRDVEAFIDAEAIRAASVPGRRELPPLDNLRYVGFVDPSGGSQDAFTLAIAHAEDGRAVLDVVRERRPPFSPEDVVQEYAALLAAYRLREVTGDRYAGEWPRERFSVHGIRYVPSERTKSDIYRELLPAVNAAKVELLDVQRLHAQLVGLERRVARGGKDSVDHPPGGHDDLANAAAGALVLAGSKRGRDESWWKHYQQGKPSEATLVARERF